ncbi:hypothetical protein IFU39_00440 [Paenibacillus sp. CFBP 13594]|uniref:hypothetical protein n=1 Tax=Paenibacillus sp. CFBP 13594 TaxID=2774037 RepID=UPI001782F1D7|nr:hypothetical protein [Paenibacillus sp. CFBP 13594]MBD8836287.1 hypothetical protein [Paenibacillus sp. CFBP 13594]
MEIAARARLRPIKDEDLREVWKNLPPHEDKSDVVRKALRLLFFGSTPYLHNSHSNHPTIKETVEFIIQSEQEQSEDTELYEEKLEELFDSF